MKVESVVADDGSEVQISCRPRHLSVTVVSTATAAAVDELVRQLGAALEARATQLVSNDGPVPSGPVGPAADSAGLPTAVDHVDDRALSAEASPTAPADDRGPELSDLELGAAASAAAPAPAPLAVQFESGQLALDDPTRADADELFAAGVSAHHVAAELGIDLDTARAWQREAR
ncbi:hypothetical protein Psed_5752 [Pseudonocardia dioxanivorans CB1190]|uniref:Uncharacterized protein n=1 Tax=Pseudonocardia dioxanivorans (strain ATCC 55486 / DSM 44775 / JCM 13855 / CB1190) TaxID=675635 RepID=F4D191_PSEUX|nr:hypothetical protein [Pseudonocardia dioxanivorans]AEA27879.1 hypothetical protein Psed_5752 [Pseudonocardia dioxanivorans CB1190]